MTEIEKMIEEAKAKVTKAPSTPVDSNGGSSASDSPDEVTIVRQDHDHIRGQAKSGAGLTGRKIRIDGELYTVESVDNFKGKELLVLSRPISYEPTTPNIKNYGFKRLDDILIDDEISKAIEKIMYDQDFVDVAEIDQNGDITITKISVLGIKPSAIQLMRIQNEDGDCVEIFRKHLVRQYYLLHVLMTEDTREEDFRDPREPQDPFEEIFKTILDIVQKQ